MEINKSDFLVIGSGLGGLFCALKLSKIGKVNIITKKNIFDSNSTYAQGGIAATLDGDFESHIKDTMEAGAYLSDKKVVEMVINSSSDIVKELISLGVNFDKKENGFSLGLEGGHRKRRILHAHDRTGKEIIDKLISRCKNDKNIKIFENHQAIDLILENHPKFSMPKNNKCMGIYAYNLKKNAIETFIAAKTILATGGAGKIYLYTSNPDTATGDGMAMGYKAGLNLINMEFVQFHPTCLYHPQARNFLISEALRGEGAILKDAQGKRFMPRYSKLKELAPRDIVARSIDFELKKSGNDFVYLDISFKNPNFIKKRFPYIYKNCLKYGIDITKQPIPVVPAAHFFCGGIEVDINGKTEIKNLYAIGEVSYTGLHGANRLASNSLLEAAVFAKRAYENIKDDENKIINNIPRYYIWDYKKTRNSNEEVIITHNWNEIRNLMSNYVGIVRNNERLLKAKKRIDIIMEEIEYYYNKYKPNKDFVELRNIAIVSKIVINSCLKRKESRGLHYNEDYLFTSKNKKNTIINRYS